MRIIVTGGCGFIGSTLIKKLLINKNNLGIIGHMQLADNPGRHEPGTGELNYPKIFNEIDAMGYEGWIGCEYIPAEDTISGLKWALPYLQ